MRPGSVALGGGPAAGTGGHAPWPDQVARTSSIASGGLLDWRSALTPGRPAGEAALVRAALRGSEEAVAALFARHWDLAYKTAYLVTGDRAAAEDIAQEAFLAALRALPRFDARRPLGPWLHRIVVNRAIDWSRARAARNEVAGTALPEPPDSEPQHAPALGEALTDALRRLGPEQRAVIVLRYLLDLRPGEIAAVLELPRGTVNSRLRRGLDALRDLMEERA